MVRIEWQTLVEGGLSNQNIYVYGAGEYGKLAAVALMDRGYNLEGFIDSNKALWGEKVLGGIVCVSIQEVKRDCLVVVAVADSVAQDSICHALKRVGIKIIVFFNKVAHDLAYKEISNKAFSEYYFSNMRKKYKVGFPRAKLDREKFDLEYILPEMVQISNDAIDYKNRKIKVRIAIVSKYLLNSYETLYQAFANDVRCEVATVVPDFYKQRFGEPLDGEKYNVLREEDYDASIDQPDILIVTFHGLNNIFFPNIYRRLGCFKLIVAATAALAFDDPVDNFDDCLIGYPFYSPDFYLVDGMMYQLVKKFGSTHTVYEMGNCKFDAIYQSYIRGKFYPSGWEKLRNKKVVLWSNDHGVYANEITHRCSFDLYAKSVFSYASQHEDLGFVIRLHPSFIDEMMSLRIWSQQDVEHLVKYCDNTPNVVWDSRPTYDVAYGVADAIIVDSFCGMTFSALPLRKPICVTYRNDIDVKPSHQELLDNYYSARSHQDLVNFFDMISMGEDPMVEKRTKAIDRYIKNFDGHNGERMKEFILKKFLEKI